MLVAGRRSLHVLLEQEWLAYPIRITEGFNRITVVITQYMPTLYDQDVRDCRDFIQHCTCLV